MHTWRELLASGVFRLPMLPKPALCLFSKIRVAEYCMLDSVSVAIFGAPTLIPLTEGYIQLDLPALERRAMARD